MWLVWKNRKIYFSTRIDLGVSLPALWECFGGCCLIILFSSNSIDCFFYLKVWQKVFWGSFRLLQFLYMREHHLCSSFFLTFFRDFKLQNRNWKGLSGVESRHKVFCRNWKRKETFFEVKVSWQNWNEEDLKRKETRQKVLKSVLNETESVWKVFETKRKRDKTVFKKDKLILNF